jgi:hypothetical protein
VPKYQKVIEIPIMEVEDLFSRGRFVDCKAEGLRVRLCFSIRALQHLFEFACKVGILLPQDDTFYVRSGEIRRYKGAKHKKDAAKETMGAGKE